LIVVFTRNTDKQHQEKLRSTNWIKRWN